MENNDLINITPQVAKASEDVPSFRLEASGTALAQELSDDLIENLINKASNRKSNFTSHRKSGGKS